jgi:hypothetical protein
LKAKDLPEARTLGALVTLVVPKSLEKWWKIGKLEMFLEGALKGWKWAGKLPKIEDIEGCSYDHGSGLI